MADLDHKQGHEEWSKIFLVNNYEDWSLEIDPEIKEDFATIALFLDYSFHQRHIIILSRLDYYLILQCLQ